MTRLEAFGGAASGEIASVADVVAAKAMGKDMDPMTLAQGIGAAVEDGVARPVTMMMATTVVAPGGGLAPKGHEDTDYKYQGGEMFGVSGP